jgi:hypothetical protein
LGVRGLETTSMNPAQTTLILTVLPLVVFGLLVYSTLRRQRQNLAQIDVSLQMSRRSLEIAEENLALNREANQLLQELIHAVQESR